MLFCRPFKGDPPPRRAMPVVALNQSKFFVYVIYSRKAGKKYTGFTTDLDRRLYQHNHNLLGTFTKNKGPWELIYYEEFDLKADALKREKYLKTGVGRDFLKQKTGY